MIQRLICGCNGEIVNKKEKKKDRRDATFYVQDLVIIPTRSHRLHFSKTGHGGNGFLDLRKRNFKNSKMTNQKPAVCV